MEYVYVYVHNETNHGKRGKMDKLIEDMNPYRDSKV
jgi:hypothetical protein